jgi:hypothetical protein
MAPEVGLEPTTLRLTWAQNDWSSCIFLVLREPNAFFGVRSAPIVPKICSEVFDTAIFSSRESEIRSEEQRTLAA